MPNTWPGGVRKALLPHEHEAWNALNYPGTRQLCSICGDETDRCEEDALWDEETDEPLCEPCFQERRTDLDEELV